MNKCKSIFLRFLDKSLPNNDRDDPTSEPNIQELPYQRNLE